MKNILYVILAFVICGALLSAFTFASIYNGAGDFTEKQNADKIADTTSFVEPSATNSQTSVPDPDTDSVHTPIENAPYDISTSLVLYELLPVDDEENTVTFSNAYYLGGTTKFLYTAVSGQQAYIMCKDNESTKINFPSYYGDYGVYDFTWLHDYPSNEFIIGNIESCYIVDTIVQNENEILNYSNFDNHDSEFTPYVSKIGINGGEFYSITVKGNDLESPVITCGSGEDSHWISEFVVSVNGENRAVSRYLVNTSDGDDILEAYLDNDNCTLQVQKVNIYPFSQYDPGNSEAPGGE